MRKVVYNACFGGFSLSEVAVLRAREISGNPKWGGAVLPGEAYPDGSIATRVANMDSVHLNDALPRHDPVLVQVVEELGKAANGELADLRIKEVSDKYRIDEYDGNETVETPDSYEWVK